MDWSQYLYISLLFLASLTGRRPILLLAVMWVNLVLTMALSLNYTGVAVADALCAIVLLFRSKREKAVCLLFALMLPLYVLADTPYFSGLKIYVIIDLLAYAQISIMGRWDGGITRIIRYFSDRGASNRHPLGAGRVHSDTARRAEKTE